MKFCSVTLKNRAVARANKKARAYKKTKPTKVQLVYKKKSFWLLLIVTRLFPIYLFHLRFLHKQPQRCNIMNLAVDKHTQNQF